MTGQGTHGGEVVRLAAELNCQPADILDFSANINPRGLPPRALAALVAAVQDPAQLRRYPDVLRHPLRRTLAEKLEVPEESIVLGAGASALIADSIRALRSARCLTFTPAFVAYQHACQAAGATCLTAPLSPATFRITLADVAQALTQHTPDLLVLNNPHNPSGTLTPCAETRAIIDAAQHAGAAVLIDEAFIDYAPGEQITREAALIPGLISIRSLTKFYGCPALRVGFAVAHPVTAQELQRQIPSWPVTSFVMDALQCAVEDNEHAAATLAETARERAFLSAGLSRLGLFVYPSTANYLLVRLPSPWPRSAQLRALLLRTPQRLLVRDCSTFDGLEDGAYIRVAVLDHASNQLLLSALAEIQL